MSNYIPDTTERFPDAGEPAAEKEYIVSGWMPVMVEVRSYGTSRDEAVREAKIKIKQSDVKRIMIDYDKSEWELAEIEEV